MHFLPDVWVQCDACQGRRYTNDILQIRFKDYSIADIANWCWVRTHKWSGVEVDRLPNLQEWMERLADRNACQKGTKIPFRKKSRKVLKKRSTKNLPRML